MNWLKNIIKTVPNIFANSYAYLYLALGLGALGCSSHPIKSELFNPPPKIEYSISENTKESLEERLNVLVLSMKEFDGLERTNWFISSGDTTVEVEEPPEYTKEKIDAVLNPKFADKGGIDPSFLARPVKYAKDNIKFQTVEKAEQLFEILRNYKGPKLDKLVIRAHGSDDGLGQNKPSRSYIGLQNLAKYNKTDFSGVMKSNGHVFLEACKTNEDYKKQLTIAEYISWLLQAPVTGSITEAIALEVGIYGPYTYSIDNRNGATYVNWFGDTYDPAPRCQYSSCAKFVTVYPGSDDAVRLELQERLLRPGAYAEDRSIKELKAMHEGTLADLKKENETKRCRDQWHINFLEDYASELEKYIQVRKELEKRAPQSRRYMNKNATRKK